MKISGLLLCGLLILFCTSPAYSAELELQNLTDGINLDSRLLLLEDSRGSMTIEDIRKLDNSRFTARTGGTLNLGYSDSVFWLKLKVKNSSPGTVKWFIESNYPLLDYITAYKPADFGMEEIEAGDRLPFSFMPFWYHKFLVYSETLPDRCEEYYFRIKSEGSVIIDLKAWDIGSFARHSLREMAFLWFFYGLMSALFIYSLFIFASSRDRSYLALSIFIINATFFALIHNGMARMHLWPDHTWWANYSHPFFMLLALIALVRFTQYYLNTRKNIPACDVVLNSLIVVLSLASLGSLTIPYSHATRMSAVLASMSGISLIVFAMIPMLRINKRQAVYYSVTWLCFSMGAVLLTLNSYGFIENNYITAWSFQIGGALGTIVMSIGVSDKINYFRKMNESVIESLKQSEQRYRLFFETAPDGIMYIIDGRPVYANRNMISMTGMDEKSFYSCEISSFLGNANSPGDDLLFYYTGPGEEKNSQKQFESVIRSRDGRRLDVLISASGLVTGKSHGIFMIVTDISKLKQASQTISDQYDKIQNQFVSLQSLNRELVSAQQKLLRANTEIERDKEYLSATLSSIGDGVITYSMDGRISLMNRVAEELTGVQNADGVGKNIREVVRLKDAKSNEMLFSALGKISEEYSFSNIGLPFQMTDASGASRTVELNSSIIKPDKDPIGIVLALRDITLKSKIDNEINKMSKLESIGILAGGIAHDFNNLLTGISGNISIAKKTDGIDDKFFEILTDIEKAAERAEALTKQLLTFAKGGAPVIVPFRISSIINESVKFILKSPEISYTIDISDDIKPVLIDPNQISQAVNNLLINAVQAMPGGGEIHIAAGNLQEIPASTPLSGNDYIFIDIKDSGQGISRKNLNKIFDPFYTTKSSGTGLGLTSTYSIIKKHGGHIEAASTPGEGTEFRIYLKCSDKTPLQAAPKKVSIETGGEGSILIMDDERYIQEVCVKMFRHLGYSVDCASTGEEAIEMYKKSLEQGRKYNYVILDLTVYGGLGGKDTIEKLLKADPDVIAIVSSGYSENPVMASYREYGFRGILKKPYKIEDIIELINSLDQS